MKASSENQSRHPWLLPQVIPKREALEKLATQYPDLEITSVETCLAFLDTTASVYGAMEAHFGRYGLSMGKFTLLMQLLEAGEHGLSPSDFAERAGVTRATITGLLDGLERDALVERQPHPSDRRRLIVYLTAHGKELLAQMLPDHFCRTRRLMETLTPQEKQMFVELLGKLRAATGAMRDS